MKDKIKMRMFTLLLSSCTFGLLISIGFFTVTYKNMWTQIVI